MRTATLLLLLSGASACTGGGRTTDARLVELAITERGVAVRSVSAGVWSPGTGGPRRTPDPASLAVRLEVDGRTVFATTVQDPRLIHVDRWTDGAFAPAHQRVAHGARQVTVPARAGVLVVDDAAGREIGRAAFDPELRARHELGLLTEPADVLGEPVRLAGGGAADESLDLVFLPDGYVEADLGDFHDYVDGIVAELAEQPDFAEHWDRVNVWRIDVRSRESGVDDLAPDYRDRDTAFDTSLNLMFFETAEGLEAAERVALAAEADVVLVVAYGDADNLVPGGAVAAAGPNAVVLGRWERHYDSLVGLALAHELGHALLGLADEYDALPFVDACFPGPRAPNVADSSDREDLPWSDLVDPATALPTPEDEAHERTLGAFEGASYCDEGMFRPQMRCLMRDPGFTNRMCGACRRQLGRFFARLEEGRSALNLDDCPAGWREDGVCDPCLGDDPDCCPECFGGRRGGDPCGDGACDAGEDCGNCPHDCGSCECGDGVCDGGEDCKSCLADCPACWPCGNGQCDPCPGGYCDRLWWFESCETCSEDCGACAAGCGDGACGGTETCRNCPADCGPCRLMNLCGNETCEAGQSCQSCPYDCGECPAGCPNGACDGGESCRSCPQDCGECVADCGNAFCELGEDCRSCPGDCGGPCPYGCGDGLCDEGEDCASCAADCGACAPACPDGACGAGETCWTCPLDCGDCDVVCGDAACEAGEGCSGCGFDCGPCGFECGDASCDPGENCSTCAADCGACPELCGNGACGGGETCVLCPADCGACPPLDDCGDGSCGGGETCVLCPADCGACPVVCGDGRCDGGESCAECPADCGGCPALCGNDRCDEGETCAACPDDCGSCPPLCGDATCTVGETCRDCEADCGPCAPPEQCGDGACDAGEDCASCPGDCGACPIVCGDRVCARGEDCRSCPEDCGDCAPDAGEPVDAAPDAAAPAPDGGPAPSPDAAASPADAGPGGSDGGGCGCRAGGGSRPAIAAFSWLALWLCRRAGRRRGRLQNRSSVRPSG